MESGPAGIAPQFLTLRESCVWAIPAFAAAEAKIKLPTHAGERINLLPGTGQHATYMM